MTRVNLIEVLAHTESHLRSLQSYASNRSSDIFLDKARLVLEDSKIPISYSPMQIQRNSHTTSSHVRGPTDHGEFCLQTLSKHPKQRISDNHTSDPVGGKSAETERSYPNTWKADMCDSSDDSESYGSINKSKVGDILDSMHASSENTSSEPTYWNSMPPRAYPIEVKDEPNSEVFSHPLKRDARTPSNDTIDTIESHTPKPPTRYSKHSYGCKTPNLARQNYSGQNIPSAKNDWASTQRMRPHERPIVERHYISNADKHSSGSIENSTMEDTDMDADAHASRQTSHTRRKLLKRRLETNGLPNDTTYNKKRKQSSSTTIPVHRPPVGVPHFLDNSFVCDQMHKRPCHDPDMVKSASLRTSLRNPLLQGVNGCLINPLFQTNFDRSDLILAAAYRQVIAAQLIQSQMAMEPVIGYSLLDTPNSLYGAMPGVMCGFTGCKRTNTLGGAFRFASSNLPYIPLPRNYTNDLSGKEDVNKMHVGDQDQPKACTPDYIRSSSVGNIDYHEQSPIRGSSVCHSRESTELKNQATSYSPIVKHCPNGNEYSNRKSAMSNCQKSPFRQVNAQSLKRGKERCKSSDVTAKTSTKEWQHPATICTELGDLDRDDKVDEKTRPSGYKDITRERRLVANARERTRVHTISSAFEELRRQIPSYSCNQKLSKLAILRIACSYIQSLSVLAGRTKEATFKESVDQCSSVLQAESKARFRRKNTKSHIEWEPASYGKSTTAGSEAQKLPAFPSRRSTCLDPPEYRQTDRFVSDAGSLCNSYSELNRCSPSPDSVVCASDRYVHEATNAETDDICPSSDEAANFGPINVDT